MAQLDLAWAKLMVSYGDDMASSFSRSNKMRDIAIAELVRFGYSGMATGDPFWALAIAGMVARMQYVLSCYVAGWI